MNPAIETALIQLGIRAADALIFQVILPWVESLVRAGESPVQHLVMAEIIVSGIEKSHPDWPGAQKATYAFDALALWLKERGKRVADRDIRFAIEMAVQKGKGHVAASAPVGGA